MVGHDARDLYFETGETVVFYQKKGQGMNDAFWRNMCSERRSPATMVVAYLLGRLRRGSYIHFLPPQMLMEETASLQHVGDFVSKGLAECLRPSVRIQRSTDERRLIRCLVEPSFSPTRDSRCPWRSNTMLSVQKQVHAPPRAFSCPATHVGREPHQVRVDTVCIRDSSWRREASLPAMSSQGRVLLTVAPNYIQLPRAAKASRRADVGSHHCQAMCVTKDPATMGVTDVHWLM